jgi:predicted ribosomally synthesized peptide with nif11-like leader
MSMTAAREFISRVEGDENFAGEIEELSDDPQAVLARVHAEGFDAEPAEIRAAFLDRYGDQLSQEQLDAIAAGALGDNLTDGQRVAFSVIFGIVGVAALF